jgi:hypothetical protein
MELLDSACLACATLVMVLPAQGFAQSSPAQQTTESTVIQSAGFDTPVAMATLEELRGGTLLVRNNMTLTGTTADNTATNVITGSNAISAGSFANMNGLPIVIQNSGANVLIQNAVILNLQMN